MENFGSLILPLLLSALVGYLLGSISFAILLTKAFAHEDVRAHGSGNAGATNVLRVAGKKASALTFLLDFCKCVASVLVGYFLVKHACVANGVDPEMARLGMYAAGFCCMIGHMYPLYFGFKGGKGVLVAAGAILAIQPVLLPFLAIIFLVCLIPTGMVSLGSVAMAALYPVLTIIYGSLQGYAAGDMLVCAIGSGFMSGMVIYMHRANIQRIREGKEYRFGKHNKK